ncbi:hypothetical protein B0H13DRAFT_1914360 [Mycena leptocephala]|nr:hypothetical protein B0H13DRAFT_1914360 [Mycena leptocephala]
MSEVSILRLYYEASLLEANDRPLLATCNFIVGELLKACWVWTQGSEMNNDASIEYYRAAAQDAFAPSHPAGFLGKLVHALRMRFEQRKNLKDIDEAIGITKELLEARPDTRRINVINLAHFIRLWFEQQPAEDPNDIEKTVVHQIRFIQQGDARDLDEAVELHCQALQSHATDDPNHSIVLGNLAAHALELRFGTGKDLDDINKAIDYFRQSLEIRMPPDPRNLLARQVWWMDMNGDGVEVSVTPLCPAWGFVMDVGRMR